MAISRGIFWSYFAVLPFSILYIELLERRRELFVMRKIKKKGYYLEASGRHVYKATEEYKGIIWK